MLELQAKDFEPYLKKCNFQGIDEIKNANFKNRAENSITPDTPTPNNKLTISCAVSGGADSTALAILTSIVSRQNNLNLQLLYVDHGLRQDSKEDAKTVSNLAKNLDAEYQCLKAEVRRERNPSSNLEANAREARHLALATAAKDVLLGHTADDQAETILLNLLWGSGTKGLAGMKKDARRPMLSLRRTDTEKICELAGISYLTDPMNKNPNFRRNRVRNEVIPLLNEIAKRDVVPILCRSADIFRQNSELLDTLTENIDPTDAKAMKELDPYLAKWAIKKWLSKTSPPDEAAINRVLSVANGKILATEIPGGYRVSRNSMKLKLEPLKKQPTSDGK